MKKILLFLVVTLFMVTSYAETVSFSGLASSDFTELSANCEMSTYTMDGVEGPSVNYTATDKSDMSVKVRGITFMYNNSVAKGNILKTGPAFLQTDGKGVSLIISNVAVGDEISMLVTAKGGTAAVFEITSGGTASSANPASVSKAEELSDYVTFKFTATATTVTIKETTGGYRIQTLTIGETTDPIDPPTDPTSTVIYNGTDWAYDQTGLNAVEGPTAALAKVNATLTVNGSDAQFTTIAEDVEASVTFNDRFFGSFTNSNADKKFVKIAKNGNIQYEGKDFIFNITGLSAGDKVVFTDNGGAVGAGFLQDGSETETHTLAAQNGTVSFTATGSTLVVKTNGTKARISKIEVISGSSSSISNPITDAIYFNGSEIINAEGLNIQVYNTLGRLIRTSNATTINMSDLQNGIYIIRAEGAKGALKINK